MKKLLILVWIFVASLLAVTAAAGGKGTMAKRQTFALDDDEQATLVYMREEEKLARDVYREMYASWGRLVFANIAESEQQHMNALARLLRKYGVRDPVEDDSTGEFSDAELSQLYGELTQDGEATLVAALEVGVAIEEMDIQDLEDAIANTDNADVKKVYGNLLKGSQNHLRAFVRNLELLGVVYDQ